MQPGLPPRRPGQSRLVGPCRRIKFEAGHRLRLHSNRNGIAVRHTALLGGLGLAILAGPAAAQSPRPTVIGTWRVDAAAQLAQRKDAPRLVVVREDSSASWGTETVRWRVKGDRLWLAIGGEWEDYRLKLKGQTLTLSEGDLTKPVSFRRVGPPTDRPAGVAVPPDPDLGG